MSRAFTKEDAQHEGVMVIARAPLPDGVENLVTTRGLALLQDEEADLRSELERSRVSGDKERRVAELEGALDELLFRVGNAVVIDPASNDKSIVRFGDSVEVRPAGGGTPFTLTIVGVDEADPDEGLVSFGAPIAVELLGHGVGERVPQGVGGRVVEIVAIR
ncbi:MAG TPA: GreA/GreB family elongation factor [Trueperaceae bacterium]|nr:GreA/GreB family elongation factor [Trueperaceae bacterium]